MKNLFKKVKEPCTGPNRFENVLHDFEIVMHQYTKRFFHHWTILYFCVLCYLIHAMHLFSTSCSIL